MKVKIKIKKSELIELRTVAQYYFYHKNEIFDNAITLINLQSFLVWCAKQHLNSLSNFHNVVCHKQRIMNIDVNYIEALQECFTVSTDNISVYSKAIFRGVHYQMCNQVSLQINSIKNSVP